MAYHIVSGRFEQISAKGNSVTYSHYATIKRMMEAFGQRTPDLPCIPTLHERRARLLMLLEEVLELASGYGMVVKMHGDPLSVDDFVVTTSGQNADLTEIADAIADIQVINTGNAVASGLFLDPIVKLVDENNLLKIEGGHLDPGSGKFIKPPNHPKPDIRGEILRQMAANLPGN
jgi:predicted HAD superfamily Cof-like phosphohydrolase